jgi:hypothetical protein
MRVPLAHATCDVTETHLVVQKLAAEEHGANRRAERSDGVDELALAMRALARASVQEADEHRVAHHAHRGALARHVERGPELAHAAPRVGYSRKSLRRTHVDQLRITPAESEQPGQEIGERARGHLDELAVGRPDAQADERLAVVHDAILAFVHLAAHVLDGVLAHVNIAHPRAHARHLDTLEELGEGVEGPIAIERGLKDHRPQCKVFVGLVARAFVRPPVCEAAGLERAVLVRDGHELACSARLRPGSAATPTARVQRIAAAGRTTLMDTSSARLRPGCAPTPTARVHRIGKTDGRAILQSRELDLRLLQSSIYDLRGRPLKRGLFSRLASISNASAVSEPSISRHRFS